MSAILAEFDLDKVRLQHLKSTVMQVTHWRDRIKDKFYDEYIDVDIYSFTNTPVGDVCVAVKDDDCMGEYPLDAIVNLKDTIKRDVSLNTTEQKKKFLELYEATTNNKEFINEWVFKYAELYELKGQAAHNDMIQSSKLSLHWYGGTNGS